MANRSFLKKLGVTVSLGAAFGLVAAGTAISVDTLQKTSVSGPAAVTAEAADQGITKGFSNVAMKTATLCTRAQAVLFLYRYAGVM